MTPPSAVLLTALRDALIAHCSLAELKLLCADLGLDYERIVDDKSNKDSATQDIVAYLARRERYADLFDWLHRNRPQADLSALTAVAQSAAALASQNAQMSVLYAEPLIYEHGQQRLPIDRLDFERERELLRQSLQQANRAITWHCAPATPDHLQRALTLGCQVLHLSGHGHPDFLAFEGQAGMTHILDVDALHTLLGVATQAPQLAFVSACHSRNLGQALADAGVPHVVAIRTDAAVLDIAAMIFARAFYRALFSGQTVGQAFAGGQAAVQTDPALTQWRMQTAERDKFLLLPEGAEHRAAPFAHAPTGQPWDLSNLPVQYGEWPAREIFVGRHEDMQQAVQGTLDERLTVLLGPAGIGKTTLAIKTAEYVRPRGDCADGLAFVGLRGVTQADGVRAAIAEALGLQADSIQSLIQQIKARRLLLLLDNGEDVIDADSGGLRDVLERLLSVRGLRVLLTSRMPPLAPRGVTPRIVELRQLAAPDAAQLLLRLAPALSTIDNTPQVQRLLSYLSGHPFAIELAARQVQRQGLSAVLDKIATERTAALRDPLLRGDAIERDGQASMIAALNLSRSHARALHPQADRLFGLFGLLPGGADEQDLDHLWEADPQAWRSALEALLDAALVQRTAGQLPRYVVFPFVSEYAEARCLLTEDRTRWSPRIATWLAGSCSAVMNGLREGNRITFGQAAAFLRNEGPNIGAALQRQGAPSLGDLGSTAAQLMLLTYRAREGLALAGDALRACRALDDRAGEANTLKALGDLRLRVDDLAGARAAYEEALPLYRQIEDKLGEANTLQALGDLRRRVADLAGARAAYEEALPLYRQIEDKLGEANTLNGIGNLLRMEGQYDAAFTHYHQALQIQVQIDNQLGVAAALLQMGRTAQAAKAHAQAIDLAERALVIYRAIGDDAFDEALAIEDQGGALLDLGEQDAAIAAWWRARALFEKSGMAGEAARLDGIFINVVQHLGEAWPPLEAQLREHAESMRALAVARVVANSLPKE